jgi:hypothetical protein
MSTQRAPCFTHPTRNLWIPGPNRPPSARPRSPFKQRRLSKHRNAQTNGRGALGSFKNSTAVAWVWTPATRLRFRPSHRDQTLGLRSANPSAGSPHLRSHPIKPPVAPEPLNPCQGAKLVLHSCLFRIPCFANRCNFSIPLQNRTANHTAVS